MKRRRNWTLAGVFVALGVLYLAFFTEWLRPAPIEITSQVRLAIQPPRFGRPPKKADPGNGPSKASQPALFIATNHTKVTTSTNRPPPRPAFDIIGSPEKGGFDQAPGGVANVTFGLDRWYILTKLRVEDIPADGSAPKVFWQLAGKSQPLDSLLYGRVPAGMDFVPPSTNAEPLLPGVPYRLIVQAGRRSGTNHFQTVLIP
jgi:hypothetical protein